MHIFSLTSFELQWKIIQPYRFSISRRKWFLKFLKWNPEPRYFRNPRIFWNPLELKKTGRKKWGSGIDFTDWKTVFETVGGGGSFGIIEGKYGWNRRETWDCFFEAHLECLTEGWQRVSSFQLFIHFEKIVNKSNCCFRLYQEKWADIMLCPNLSVNLESCKTVLFIL